MKKHVGYYTYMRDGNNNRLKKFSNTNARYREPSVGKEAISCNKV
ncbi:hypothetical protein [Fodinibius saliphilus]|nr:hypothetical protein [Fodinibius saliphilus]